MALLAFALLSVVDLVLSRALVQGDALFNPQSFIAAFWIWLPMLWLGWWALSSDASPGGAGRKDRLAAWTVLSLGANLLPTTAVGLLGIAYSRELVSLPEPLNRWLFWSLYGILVLWLLSAEGLLLARLGAGKIRALLATLGLAALTAASLWVPMESAWYADPANQPAQAERERLHLSQQTFEAQQALWPDLEQNVAAQRPGVVDVYGLVFAPYGDDVFLREGAMVAEVLGNRFEAGGRLVRLQNHAITTGTLPWATPANLRRAIRILAARMDLAEDVLVVYLTSHGGSDFRLAARHWPLEVEDLTPQVLRAALDETGIRYSVIAISACYSGGWVDPLAASGTLVMTAADATHTSYGCGYKSPLTYFGRAVFDEQLRQTHSFQQAFAQAVPIIARREEEGGKTDGFSNPQIRVGDAIVPVLAALERRLDGR